MALDENGIVWEVRPTNGSDNNGGGFLTGATGTDFSQQNSPQQAYTDLVAASTTTITSVARPFSSVDVGNIINITSGTGWTTGRYQIISVTVVTATMDRAIATNGSTGGHGNLGGALATWNLLANLNDGATASITTVKAFVKAEATITITARPDFQHLTNLSITGYTSSRTDNGQVSVTTSNGTDNLILFRGSGYLIVGNVHFSDSSGTRHQAIQSVNSFDTCIITNCIFDGHSKAIDFTSNTNTIKKLVVRQCEVKNCIGAGLSLQIVNNGHIDDCFIHDNTGNGVDILATATAMGLTFNRCAIRANAIGVKSVDDGAVGNNSALFFLNCAIVSNTSDGIKHVGTGTNFSVVTYLQGTIIYGNTGFGINVASGLLLYCLGGYNAFGSNTGGARNNFPTLTGDVALTANPFTSDSTGDFSLNSTSGGGPVCKSAGFPPSFP